MTSGVCADDGDGALARAAGGRTAPPVGSAPDRPKRPPRRRTKPDPRARLAHHEAAHVVVGRATGRVFGGATIRPGDGFAGQVWGSQGKPMSAADAGAFTSELASAAMQAMPPVGESREDAGPWIAHVQASVVEALAGVEAERKLGVRASETRAGGRGDLEHAMQFALSITFTPEAAVSFLRYARHEAHGLVRQYWPSIRAVADTLLKHVTIDARQIDEAIALGLARQDLARERKARAWRARAEERAARLSFEPLRARSSPGAS